MEEKSHEVPYHPPQDPVYPEALTADYIRQVFSDCADLYEREVLVGNDPEKVCTMFTLVGMVRNERLSDYVLKPMAEDPRLREMSLDQAMEWMLRGGLHNFALSLRSNMDDVALDLAMGNAVFAFPGRGQMLSCIVPTEEKRSISPPESEPVLKGGKDAFVESIRTNTAIVRRRIRTPKLKIREVFLGRQSQLQVDMLFIEGLTNPELVRQTEHRLHNIDIDALITTANLEEYLVDTVRTPFPLIANTERSDRFSSGLMAGRVGILADGLPLGFLLPGNISFFFQTGEDSAKNWLEASFLRGLRYLCMLMTLLLPALYVAAVNFHPEMIPAQLAWSIAQAKQDVPFSTVFEVMTMLIAFEIIQEAGLRLPPAIGTTVSILGGLVVGTAAVEAKIVSPAVLIVVAIAGIAGYTMPSQEFAGALRLWRIGMVVAASLAGIFGIGAATVVLVHHLASLESFGVPYLTPFAAKEKGRAGGVVRRPLPFAKLRDRSLKTRNRRNQK